MAMLSSSIGASWPFPQVENFGISTSPVSSFKQFTIDDNATSLLGILEHSASGVILPLPLIARGKIENFCNSFPADVEAADEAAPVEYGIEFDSESMLIAGMILSEIAK